VPKNFFKIFLSKHLVETKIFDIIGINSGRTAVSIEKKRLPPYISYQTFNNFVRRLSEQPRLPARIDNGYRRETLSGSNSVQMMTGMRFLGLVDEFEKPTGQLQQFVQAKGDQQKAVLADIVKRSYSFVFKLPNYDKDATRDQLVGCFQQNYQLKPDVLRKCIKFFVLMSDDAGVTLSPFMTKKFRKASARTKVPEQKSSGKKVPQKTYQNLKVPELAEVPETDNSWHSKLLEKFPKFDPAWGEEAQNRWFSAFDKLLERGSWNIPRK